MHRHTLIRSVPPYHPIVTSAPRELPLFDRSQPKPFWTDHLTEDEVAVLASDQPHACTVFPSRESARRWARQRVTADTTLICELYDRRGKAGPPLETVAAAAHFEHLNVPHPGRRKIVIAWLCIAGSVPLFWLDWTHDLLLIVPTIFGFQLIVLALRLLYWGYSERANAREAHHAADDGVPTGD